MMETIKKFIEKFLRECRKITDFIPIAVFQMLRVVLGGSLISSIIFAIPGVNNFLASLVYSESMVEFLKLLRLERFLMELEWKEFFLFILLM